MVEAKAKRQTRSDSNIYRSHGRTLTVFGYNNFIHLEPWKSEPRWSQHYDLGRFSNHAKYPTNWAVSLVQPIPKLSHAYC
jgi:hypothetical protein